MCRPRGHHHAVPGAGRGYTSGTTRTGTASNRSNGGKSRTTPTTPPTAPSNLSASAGDTTVALTWKASTYPRSAIAGYRVFRNASQVGQTSSTGYTDTGLTDGSSYNYYVKAYDRFGNVSSRSSNVLATPVDIAAPTAPALAASPGDQQVMLSWSRSTDPDNGVVAYAVYRDGTQVAQTASLTYTDTKLTNGTAYSYDITAYDKTGNASAASNAVSATPVASSPPPSPKLYWGAFIGNQFDGGHPPWDMTSVTDFANADAGGKGVSLIPWGQYFYSTNWCGAGGYCTFWPSLFDTVRNYGALNFFTWQSSTTDGSEINTDAQIAGGAQDTYITQWAQAAKAYGHPFFLRFDWEMNGKWFPWSPGVNGNTASAYVAMWRHVHNIFTSVGATNVSWVWCPNVDPHNTMTSLASLYPGDTYVDWTCLDGYNGNSPWTSFTNLFQATYDEITQTIAPSKPMIVAESGSTESGGSKAQWITNMLNALPTRFPQIHGFMWWEQTSSGPGGYTDWPIESSASSQAAFAQGISSPSYVPNSYATLNTSPIPPPT